MPNSSPASSPRPDFGIKDLVRLAHSIPAPDTPAPVVLTDCETYALRFLLNHPLSPPSPPPPQPSSPLMTPRDQKESCLRPIPRPANLAGESCQTLLPSAQFPVPVPSGPKRPPVSHRPAEAQPPLHCHRRVFLPLCLAHPPASQPQPRRSPAQVWLRWRLLLQTPASSGLASCLQPG